MSQESADRYNSLGEFAAQLNFSRRTAVRRVKEGDVPTYKFGGLVRIRQSDIDAYVERSRRGDAAPVEPEPVRPRRKPRRARQGATA